MQKGQQKTRQGSSGVNGAKDLEAYTARQKSIGKNAPAGSGSTHDISKRKTIEEALALSNQRISDILSSITDDFYVLDRDWKFVYTSRSFTQKVGKEPEDFIGNCIWDMFPKHTGTIYEENLRAAMEKRELRRFEVAGKYTPATYSMTCFPSDEGITVMGADITERKNAEAALRASEERFKAIASNTPDHILVQDRDLRYIFVVNPQMGLTQEDMIGKLDADFLTKEDAENLTRIKRKVIETGQPIHLELPLVSKTGETQTFAGSYVPKFDDRGLVDGLIGYFQDITEKKHADDNLMRLNRTLKALSDINQAMLRSTTEAEYMQEVCRIVVEDCGHAMVWIGMAEQDQAKSVRPVAFAGFEQGYLDTLKITWADTERGRGPTGTAIRTGRMSMCRNMLTDPQFEPWRKEALKRGYASSIVLPLMSEGTAFGAITIYAREPDPFSRSEIDLLTELASDLAYGILALRVREAHAQAEAALALSEEKYRNLVRLAPAAIYELDFYGRKVISVNDTACQWLDYTREELMGMDPLSITDDDGRLRFQERIRQKLAEEAIAPSVELNLRTKDGRTVVWELNVGNFAYKDGKPVSALVVAHDTTDRKRMEEEVRQSAIELKAANDELSRFNAAMVGRELRMIELKKEINSLCVRSGEAPRYKVDLEGEEA